MRRIIFYVLSIFILFLLQASVIPVFIGSVPNILLIWFLLLSVLPEGMVIFGQEIKFDDIVLSASASGLMLDIIGSHIFGLYTVFFMLAVFLARFLSGRYIEAGQNVKNSIMVLLLSGLVLPVVTEITSKVYLSFYWLLLTFFANLLAIIILSLYLHVRTRRV